MGPRSRSNPLALAVLTSLYERPMHPYEIGQTLRARAKHESIRLNYGSLYSVVESLARLRLIRAVETTREGRRPQRTIYEITDRSTVEMHEWLAELVAVPAKEYPQLAAALSLIAALPPDEVVPLLEQRCMALELRVEQSRALHEAAVKAGAPPPVRHRGRVRPSAGRGRARLHPAPARRHARRRPGRAGRVARLARRRRPALPRRRVPAADDDDPDDDD